jgi:hypothetical protein
MKRHLSILFTLFVSIALSACVIGGDGPGDDLDDDEPIAEPPTGGASGGDDNTFDHPNSMPDIWDLIDRMADEGPPEYSARVHSCPKMRYDTIGRLLESRGVDLSTNGETQAGFMYTSSDQALGAPNYGARARENLELTTASASKLFDIFVQAAPEVIAAMPDRDECTVGGEGTRMFNDANQCTADGIACLLGVPATAGHIELCNEMVNRASTIDIGKNIAVAALLSAAHTCE